MSDDVTGPQGETGETGEAGPIGETGEQGTRGPRGAAGRAGDPSPDIARLITTIDKLRANLSAHKAELAIADHRSRWARTASVVGIAVGILGVAVGAGGAVFGINAQDSADELAQARQQSLVSGCVQANLTTERVRAALVAGVSVLSTPTPERSPEGQARLDEFVAVYTARVEEALPYRDCSPAGIAAYYAHPPADPAAVQTSSTTITRG